MTYKYRRQQYQPENTSAQVYFTSHKSATEEMQISNLNKFVHINYVNAENSKAQLSFTFPSIIINNLTAFSLLFQRGVAIIFISTLTSVGLDLALLYYAYLMSLYTGI